MSGKEHKLLPTGAPREATPQAAPRRWIGLAYGVATLALGVTLAIATLAWRQMPILQSESSVPFVFILSAVLFVPFIATYSQMGLGELKANERRTPEAERRYQRLLTLCPWWRVVWYGGMALVALSWFSAAWAPGWAHGFYAFCGLVCILAGSWQLFALPALIDRLVD